MASGRKPVKRWVSTTTDGSSKAATAILRVAAHRAINRVCTTAILRLVHDLRPSPSSVREPLTRRKFNARLFRWHAQRAARLS